MYRPARALRSGYTGRPMHLDGTTHVVLLTEGLILAGCKYFRLYIDTNSDVGLYTLSFTVIFATGTGGLRPPSIAWGLETSETPLDRLL